MWVVDGRQSFFVPLETTIFLIGSDTANAWSSSLKVKSSSPEDTSQTPDTQVTVQIFDSKPFSLTVPGSITLDDDLFMDTVSRDALRDYKNNKV